MAASVRLLCVALLALVALSGCRRAVPKEHTSLVQNPGKDPGPPSRRLSMNWLHHSTGQNILEGGLLLALKRNNVDFYDMFYGEGKADDGYVIGDHTDPPDFPKNFNTPKYLRMIKSWERGSGKHDVVMFKSCFPYSHIKSDAQLDKYKEYYKSLLPTFKANPDTLFIAMSTPPLNAGETTAEAAARARKWAKWVTTEYAKELKNVQVFDIFNALAIQQGKPNANTLAPQFAHAKYDSHVTRAGARAVTRMFVPWFNRVLRESGLVN